MEDFPLFSSKFAVFASDKVQVCLSWSRVFEITVAYREFRITNIAITSINNANVAASENWAFLHVASYGELRKIETEFFFHSDWKDEWSQLFISGPVLFRRVPSQRSIASYNFSKFSLYKDDRMRRVIAFSVESLSAKSIFTRSKDFVDLFDWSMGWKQGLYVFKISCNFAVDNFYRCDGLRFRNGLQLLEPFYWSFIDFWDLIQTLSDVIIDGFEDFFIENEFTINSLLILDEKFWNDVVQSASCDLVVIFVVYLLYEFHHVFAVAKCSGKDFKFEVFIFDFFNESTEESFHLFRKLCELRSASVWVFVDDIVQLSPRHLLAILMEESALTSVVNTFLADETGFLAIGIDTEDRALVAINALWMLFDLTRHDSIGI